MTEEHIDVNQKDEPNYQSRTFTMTIRNKDQIKIFNKLGEASKYVYNSAVYCTDIYNRYYQKICEEMYREIGEKNKLLNKKKTQRSKNIYRNYIL